MAQVSTCFGNPASITATGATKFKWYKSFTGGAPFFNGSTYNTSNLYNDTTFYVSNAEYTYESVRTAAKILVKANPTIFMSRSPVMCSNESMTLSVADADTYLWSTGATTKSIQVNTAGSYGVTVSSLVPSCQSTSSTPVVLTVNPAPVAQFEIATAELKTYLDITFTDQSTGAISWFWDFGNGQTSVLTNPSVLFTSSASYNVTLTVKSDNGCQATASKSISVVTGLDKEQYGTDLSVFPNPFRSSFFVSTSIQDPLPITIQLFDLLGKQVYQKNGETSHLNEIPSAELPEGMYLVRVMAGNRIFCQRVTKVH